MGGASRSRGRGCICQGLSGSSAGARAGLKGAEYMNMRREGRAEGGWKGFEGEYCASATYETSAHKAAGSRPPPPPPPPPTHGITSTSGISLNLAPPSGSRGAVETATYARLPMSRAVTRLPSRMTWYANTW